MCLATCPGRGRDQVLRKLDPKQQQVSYFSLSSFFYISFPLSLSCLPIFLSSFSLANPTMASHKSASLASSHKSHKRASLAGSHKSHKSASLARSEGEGKHRQIGIFTSMLNQQETNCQPP